MRPHFAMVTVGNNSDVVGSALASSVAPSTGAVDRAADYLFQQFEIIAQPVQTENGVELRAIDPESGEEKVVAIVDAEGNLFLPADGQRVSADEVAMAAARMAPAPETKGAEAKQLCETEEYYTPEDEIAASPAQQFCSMSTEGPQQSFADADVFRIEECEQQCVWDGVDTQTQHNAEQRFAEQPAKPAPKAEPAPAKEKPAPEKELAWAPEPSTAPAARKESDVEVEIAIASEPEAVSPDAVKAAEPSAEATGTIAIAEATPAPSELALADADDALDLSVQLYVADEINRATASVVAEAAAAESPVARTPAGDAAEFTAEIALRSGAMCLANDALAFSVAVPLGASSAKSVSAPGEAIERRFENNLEISTLEHRQHKDEKRGIEIASDHAEFSRDLCAGGKPEFGGSQPAVALVGACIVDGNTDPAFIAEMQKGQGGMPHTGFIDLAIGRRAAFLESQRLEKVEAKHQGQGSREHHEGRDGRSRDDEQQEQWKKAYAMSESSPVGS